MLTTTQGSSQQSSPANNGEEQPLARTFSPAAPGKSDRFRMMLGRRNPSPTTRQRILDALEHDKFEDLFLVDVDGVGVESERNTRGARKWIATLRASK